MSNVCTSAFSHLFLGLCKKGEHTRPNKAYLQIRGFEVLSAVAFRKQIKKQTNIHVETFVSHLRRNRLLKVPEGRVFSPEPSKCT